MEKVHNELLSAKWNAHWKKYIVENKLLLLVDGEHIIHILENLRLEEANVYLRSSNLETIIVKATYLDVSFSIERNIHVFFKYPFWRLKKAKSHVYQELRMYKGRLHAYETDALFGFFEHFPWLEFASELGKVERI